MAWSIVRLAWDSCFSWFFKLDPLRVKQMRVLRLDGSDVSSHFSEKYPLKRMPSCLSLLKQPWPKLWRLLGSLSSLRHLESCYTFLLWKLRECSCRRTVLEFPWEYSKKRSFSLVLFTDFTLPRSSRRLSYKECSCDNLNRSFPEFTSCLHNLQARQTRWSYTRFHQCFAHPCLISWRDRDICLSIQSSISGDT